MLQFLKYFLLLLTIESFSSIDIHTLLFIRESFSSADVCTLYQHSNSTSPHFIKYKLSHKRHMLNKYVYQHLSNLSVLLVINYSTKKKKRLVKNS